MNLLLYLLNYIKSTEYYQKMLLGIRDFECTCDVTGTYDEFIYGVHSLHFKFVNESDDLFLADNLNVEYLLSKIDILNIDIYSDVEILRWNVKNFLGKDYDSSDFNGLISLIIDSDNYIEHTKELYWPTDVNYIDFKISMEKFIWKESKFYLDDVTSKVLLATKSDKSHIFCFYEIDESSLISPEIMKSLYESDLNICFCLPKYVDWTIEQCYRFFNGIKRGKGEKELLILQPFIKESSIKGRKTYEINENILKCYSLFDNIYFDK